MALISCMECGKEISDRAAFCPHCGFPLQEQVEISNNLPQEQEESLHVTTNTAVEEEKRPVNQSHFSEITSFINHSQAPRIQSGTMKRWGWFILVNVAIIVSMSIMSGGALAAIAPIFLLFGCTFPFISLLFSKALAKRSHGIYVINPENFQSRDEQDLYEMVASLCKKAGIEQTPEIGIYESPDVNAFATGASKNNSLVAFSTALLDKMDEQAISAVADHEVAHIANGDMVTLSLVQSVVNTVVMLITLPLNMIKWVAFFSENVSTLMFVLISIVKFIATIILAFLGSLVVKAFSRKREFAADQLASELIHPDAMIYALENLKQDTPVIVKEQQAYAAMKISTPEKMLDIFSTHPSLERRIERLQNNWNE